MTADGDVAEYQRLALRRGRPTSAARGRVPVLVGGSGMYVRAVVDRWDFPGTDPEVRARLDAELAAAGPGALHERLAELDPAAAIAILPSNGRRIVRALEVVELRGRSPRRCPTFDAEPRRAAIGLRVAARASSTSGSRARVDRMWAGRASSTRCARSRRGAARGAHGVPRARLRAGAGVPRRRVHRGGGARADGTGHPAVRPPPGVLVPPGPPVGWRGTAQTVESTAAKSVHAAPRGMGSPISFVATSTGTMDVPSGVSNQSRESATTKCPCRCDNSIDRLSTVLLVAVSTRCRGPQGEQVQMVPGLEPKPWQAANCPAAACLDQGRDLGSVGVKAHDLPVVQLHP